MCKLKDIGYALSFIKVIEGSGLEPDIVIFSIIIDGYARSANSVMHLTFSLKEIIIRLPPKVKNRNLLFRFKILVTSRTVPNRLSSTEKAHSGLDIGLRKQTFQSV